MSTKIAPVEYVGDDIYCDEILSGRMTVRTVAETEQVLAFHHTNPFWPAHIVVIPKAHVSSLIGEDATVEVLDETLAVARAVARQVADEHGEAGIMTYVGNLQHSKHLHWHVVAGEQLRPTPPRTHA